MLLHVKNNSSMFSCKNEIEKPTLVFQSSFCMIKINHAKMLFFNHTKMKLKN